MKLFFSFFVLVTILFFGCSKAPEAGIAETVTIISIAPSSGPAGTTVVIKGAHFGIDPSDNIVRFNNDLAAVVAAAEDSLLVIAPANGTSGPISVSVAGSTATGPVFSYTSDSVDVYVAAPAMGVVYWKNGQEIFLEPTQNNIGGAYGLAVSDTNVYVGGYKYFGTYPGFQAAYWKNGKKTVLSSADSAGQVRCLVLAGNDLYVGGSQNSMPVYWKNGTIHRLPTFGNGYARVNALAINGNDVYAAGFEAGPGNEQRSVSWKNGVETLLGRNGVVDVGATSIALNGNDVYVCATDSGDAVYWKNGVRITLAKYEGQAPVEANAIAIADKSIYVAGSFRGEAVYWKDGTQVTLPRKSFSAAASAITFHQSDIYIGGADGNTPVYWKNQDKIVLCCSEYGRVSAIKVIPR